VNQTIVEIFSVVNELPSVLHDCSIPTPAWLNNTLAVENCTFAIFDLYQTIVKIQNDIDNKDIARIIEDVQQFLQSAEEVRNRCSQNGEEEQEQEIIVVDNNATDLPINVTNCLESADQLAIVIKELKEDKTNIKIWNQVFYHLEVVIGQCGDKFLEEALEKDFPPNCVESIDDFIIQSELVYKDAEEIADKQSIENAIKLAKAVDTLLQYYNDLRQQCPLLNEQELQAMNFEDYFVDIA
jgi:hypothetical protein